MDVVSFILVIIALLILTGIIIYAVITGNTFERTGPKINIVSVGDNTTTVPGGFCLYLVNVSEPSYTFSIPASEDNVQGVMMYIANQSQHDITINTKALKGYSVVDTSSGFSPDTVEAGTTAQFVYTGANILLRL